MAFFPRSFYGSPEPASFQPLFRLLSDFDSYSRQSSHHHGHRNNVPSFQPKFDVREVEDAYELHGELSGMKKEDVQIQFTDPHTLHVRGRVVRSYTSGNRNNVSATEAAADSKMSGAITEGTEASTTTSTAPAAAEEDAASVTSNSHRATVEDDFEDVAEEAAGSTRASTPTVEATPTTTVAEVAPEEPVAAPKEQQQARPVAKRDSARYWVSERSIGEFSRSFHFPGQIVQEAVTAGLQDGVLTIRVPKAPKHEARTILIN